MQENNYPELIRQMEALGLGKDPSLHLLNSVYRELPSINLHVRDTYGTDQVDAFLHFFKQEASTNYVLTHWDIKVQNLKEPLLLKQTFTVANNLDSITLMEGYNLLQGRSIYKSLPMENGEKLSTWCALDFKNTDRNGNFALKVFGNQYNLEELAHRYPIDELQIDEKKRWLIRALEEGGRVPVTIKKEDGEHKVYVEAAPHFNSIKLFDLYNRPIAFSKLLQQDQNEKKTIKRVKEPIRHPTKLRL